MQLNATNFTTFDSTLEVRPSTISGYISMRIGDLHGSNFFTMIPTQDFIKLADQWAYELSAAIQELLNPEFEAHADDNTLVDLVHGADDGGKQ